MVEIWGVDSTLEEIYASERENEPGFDGNRTDAIRNWFFPVGSKFEMNGEIQDEFMRITVLGHLFWVVFPVGGVQVVTDDGRKPD